MNNTKDRQAGELRRLSLQNTHRPLDVIAHWHKEGCLLLDPPYQRGDVWGPIRQRNLIRSLLTGIPIPSIIVNDRYEADWNDDCSFAVIDGKQRITTILAFLSGDLPIPGEWVGMSCEVTYKDLGVVRQRKMRCIPMAFSEGRLPTIEDETEVFELVNFGGVPQGESDFP